MNRIVCLISLSKCSLLGLERWNRGPEFNSQNSHGGKKINYGRWFSDPHGHVPLQLNAINYLRMQLQIAFDLSILPD